MRLGKLRWGKTGARRGAILRVLIAAQLAAVLVIGARHLGWLQPPELIGYDALIRAFATPSATPPKIAVVGITEPDIGRFGWPLPDAVLAEVLSRLARAGAVTIGVDLYRDMPVPPGNDTLEAVQAALPSLFWVRKIPEGNRPGVPAPRVLAGTPAAVMADNAPDPGEVVRRALLIAEDQDGKLVKLLGAAIGERASGHRFRPTEDGISLGRRPVVLVEPDFGPYAGVDASGYQMLIDFRGGRDRFTRLSIADVIDTEPAKLAELVRGKAVLVGSDATSVKDHFVTPLTTGPRGGFSLPGVEVHAHIADQLMRLAAGEPATLRPLLGRIAEDGVVWAACMLGAVVPLLAGTGIASIPVALGSLGVIAGGTIWGFSHGLLLPGVPALVGFLLASAIAAWLLSTANRQERLRLKRAFEHYLDPRIIGAIAEDGADPGLDGAEREITAMFTDLAGFTTTSETMAPAELAALLQDYFEGLCDAVIAEGGLVVSFMGDGMLALFGAPLPQDDHADRALRAAAAIDRFSRGFEAKKAAEGVSLGVTRIGLHSGRAMVGNLGTRTRLQYGAIGDVLNTASRLEGVNKQLGTRICVSGATAALAKDARLRPVGSFPIRGRAGEIEVLVPAD
jgi:adenylate cyclase